VSAGDRIRVVVVDDVELARRRHVVALEQDVRFEVVADAADLRSVLPAVADGPVDVAVLTLAQGGVASPGTLSVARAALPGARLVVLLGPRDDPGPALAEAGPGSTWVARAEAARTLVPAVQAVLGVDRTADAEALATA
jgi:DNA-binding NarL/FixJ family response regulator